MSGLNLGRRGVAVLSLGLLLAGACRTPNPDVVHDREPQTPPRQPQDQQQFPLKMPCDTRPAEVKAFLTGMFLVGKSGPYAFLDLTRSLGPQGVPLPLNQKLYFTAPVRITLVPETSISRPSDRLDGIACQVDVLYIPKKFDAASLVQIAPSGQFQYFYQPGSLFISLPDDWIIYLDGGWPSSSSSRGTGTGTVGYQTSLHDGQLAISPNETQDILAIYGGEGNSAGTMSIESKNSGGSTYDTKSVTDPGKYRTLTRASGNTHWQIGASDQPCSAIADLYHEINQYARMAGLRELKCPP
jgi:hypothetical protein